MPSPQSAGMLPPPAKRLYRRSAEFMSGPANTSMLMPFAPGMSTCTRGFELLCADERYSSSVDSFAFWLSSDGV